MGFFGFRGGLAAEAYRMRVWRALGLGKTRRGRALDLGCGDGEEALLLAGLGYQVDGLDLEPRPGWAALNRKARGRVKLKRGDASTAGRPASYDLAFQKDMLHHADDPVKVLRRMAALVRPGGQVVLVEANRLNPVFYLHLTLMEGHEHFTAWRLRSHLREAGLTGYEWKVLEARVWPFNAPWAQAFFERFQDFFQWLPLWRPFACYHVVRWTKPGARR